MPRRMKVWQGRDRAKKNLVGQSRDHVMENVKFGKSECVLKALKECRHTVEITLCSKLVMYKASFLYNLKPYYKKIIKLFKINENVFYNYPNAFFLAI